MAQSRLSLDLHHSAIDGAVYITVASPGGVCAVVRRHSAQSVCGKVKVRASVGRGQWRPVVASCLRRASTEAVRMENGVRSGMGDSGNQPAIPQTVDDPSGSLRRLTVWPDETAIRFEITPAQSVGRGGGVDTAAVWLSTPFQTESAQYSRVEHRSSNSERERERPGIPAKIDGWDIGLVLLRASGWRRRAD